MASHFSSLLKIVGKRQSMLLTTAKIERFHLSRETPNKKSPIFNPTIKYITLAGSLKLIS